MTEPTKQVIFAGNDFDADVIAASHQKLIIVHFLAQWAAPCRKQRGVLDSFVDKVGEGVVIGELDVDDSQSTALNQRYNVRAVPTILFFKEGKEVQRILGYDEESILEYIKKWT
jgi:thioredoxin 1